MVEKIEKTGDEVIIRPGKDKPAPIPGRVWFPVKNNPLKPQQIRAWRLGEPGTGEPFPKDGTGVETRVEGLPGDPPTLGNRTPDEIERSRRDSRVVSGVEKSLPRGD